MPNNRKRTKGRKIQAIKVPTTIISFDNPNKPAGEIIKNPHKKAGGTIQVRHY